MIIIPPTAGTRCAVDLFVFLFLLWTGSYSANCEIKKNRRRCQLILTFVCANKLIRLILNTDDIDQKKGHHWILNYSCSYTNNTNTILTIILEVWNTLNSLHSEVYEFNCTWTTYTIWCLKAISRLVSCVYLLSVYICNWCPPLQWVRIRGILDNLKAFIFPSYTHAFHPRSLF